MKPTQITMQIVKNLGNYETARLECTYTLDDGDEVAIKTIGIHSSAPTMVASHSNLP